MDVDETLFGAGTPMYKAAWIDPLQKTFDHSQNGRKKGTCSRNGRE